MDNAATSWPKPPGVEEAMLLYLREEGGNPGRSGHRLSLAASRRIFQVRLALAEFLGVKDPARIIFTQNATEALSLALIGSLNPQDRVLSTAIEHNAVSRTLSFLRSCGVDVEIISVSPRGSLDVTGLESALKRKKTKMVVVNWASNVAGWTIDLDEVSGLVKRYGALLLVDAAQGLGHLPLLLSDRIDDRIDMLAASGHKGLLGPQGTGFLYLGPSSNPRPLIYGGTGSASSSDEQPGFLPDKYESGTLNGPGIAGLGAGLGTLLKEGVIEVARKEACLAATLAKGLMEIPGVKLHGAWSEEKRVLSWLPQHGAEVRMPASKNPVTPADDGTAAESSGGVVNARTPLAGTDVGDGRTPVTTRAPVLGVPGIPDAVAVVSMTLEGWDPAQLAFELDRRYGIMVRAGLHCSPWAHRTLGTFPTGTVRFSPGLYTTPDEIETVVSAVKELAIERKGG
ncbi:MAG TPA: aminotransferase class V-fold PLP-dependent enzyme [Clostridia bacterium]|nr:aminotransferase class V-fold PLP-dependent enzyme [Clostridia bacterium]